MSARPTKRGWADGAVVPVLVVLAVLMVIWYAAAVWLNAPAQIDRYGRDGLAAWSQTQLIADTLSQERPKLPGPHQIVAELWNTVFGYAPTSNRSMLYHAWITFSATGLGFVIGTALGIALAVLIVHNRATNHSLMPWVIASQTIPILAIAPMIVVIAFNLFTGQLGLDPNAGRLVSKALISAYLAFFPVTVGMVKGLRSPEAIQLDLMRTYSANPWQTFWKLRWPAAMPYLFASMKVGVAASLIGTIVGELPTGANGGIGARLLAGSYYGQTIQIWAALFAASILAAALVGAVGIAQRAVDARMGVRP